MHDEIEILIIGNALVYILTFWIYYKMKRSFNVGSYLLLVWAISAIASVYFYYSGMRVYDKITILPFLYLYSLVMLSFLPILNFRGDKLHRVYANEFIITLFVYIVVLISFEPFIENLVLLLKSFQGDTSAYISNAYDAQAEGYSSVSQDITQGMSWLGRKLNIINIWLKEFIPILLFYQLTLKKKNKLLIYGLIIATINPICHSYIHAVRVNIVTDMMYIFFLFLLFKSMISSRMVKNLSIYGGSVIVGIGLLVIIITVYRFENTFGQTKANTSIGDWISLYIGEGMLNFNQQMWNIKKTMGGDNNFSLFKDLMGLDTFTDNLLRRSHWDAKTGISGNIFYTHIGDFLGDLGHIGAVLFVAFITLIFSKLTKAVANMPLHRIVLFSLWFKICLMGFTYYTFKVSTESIHVLVLLAIYFVLRIGYTGIVIMKEEYNPVF